MISKADIAAILGLQESDISDQVYNWAIEQFYLLTGYRATPVSKTFRKMFKRSSESVCLPSRNISSIDAIRLNGIAQTFTINIDAFLNEDTGFFIYNGGFSGKTEIDFTIGSYTHTTSCDTLVSLLCTKGLALFQPDKVGFVKRIKLGDYEKEFFGFVNYKDGYIDILNREIDTILDLILHGGNGLITGVIR